MGIRKLTAIFSSKRSTKSDTASSVLSDNLSHSSTSATPPDPKPSKPRSSFFRSLSRSSSHANSHSDPNSNTKQKRHLPFSLLTNQHPSSSASSSSGGPQTPDDDRASLMPADPSRSASWLSNAGPPTVQSHHSLVSAPGSPPFKPPLGPPLLALPCHLHPDSDSDSDSDHSSESDLLPSPADLHPLSLSPLAYFQALTVNSIAPPFSPPPLLHLPGCPVFPRSSNPTHALSNQNSLASLMFKKRLLRSVVDGDISPLDAAALAAYASGPRVPPPTRPSLYLDDNAVKDAKRIERFSRGLKWWVNRPCFEDRTVLYVPQDGTRQIQTLRIIGSKLAVAALEFSDGLEALGGFDEEPESPHAPPLHFAMDSSPNSLPSPPPASLSAPSLLASASTPSLNKPQSPASPPQPRSPLYRAAPSPLRVEHTSESPQLSSVLLPSLSPSPSESSTVIGGGSPPVPALISPSASSVGTPTIVLSPNSPESKPRPLSQPPAKPGVRFAEDTTREDQIPLGYVLRIKRKREEKARFLQVEKERRAFEEERRRHEEERKKQEEERRKWEVERETWSRERKAIEEERKKRLYAEEVVAARNRRESVRMGSVQRVTEGSPIMWDGDREREREKRGREAQPTYLRPTYDTNLPGLAPKRGKPEGAMPSSPDLQNGSPGSSRPPSVGGSGSASGSMRGSSRPPSIYSTPPSSAADIHSRERRESKASRRGSSVSEPSQWVGINPSYSPQFPWNMGVQLAPPVPPLPMMPVVPMVPYSMDTPLLPPTPPFMFQQFGPRNPSQQRSHSSSPRMAHHIPSSHSSDRVNLSSSSQPSSANVRHHERRSSGDISELHKTRRSSGQPTHSYSHHQERQGSSSSLRDPSAKSAATASLLSKKSDSHRSSASRPSSTSRPPPVPTHPMPTSAPHARPTPILTASRTQPAFQNLSRPTANRRQTMIS